MKARVACRPGTLAVEQLPPDSRAFADFPCAPVTETTRRFHLQIYARWCAERQVEQWPATLSRLMTFAAERAPGRSYLTIREHVRIVSMAERRRSGIDLFARTELQQLLEGIKRECPPQPVLPLRPAQVERLFAYRPTTRARRVARTAILLSFAAGFSLTEHMRARCEMVEFGEAGATISGLGVDRPMFFVGRARNEERCPVRALRELIGERAAGPLYTSPYARSEDKALTYWALVQQIVLYGRLAGVAPLSNNRIRVAGLIEQARHIDIVRLAHFHGYRSVHALATLLGRYVEVNANLRFAQPRE